MVRSRGRTSRPISPGSASRRPPWPFFGIGRRGPMVVSLRRRLLATRRCYAARILRDRPLREPGVAAAAGVDVRASRFSPCTPRRAHPLLHSKVLTAWAVTGTSLMLVVLASASHAQAIPAFSGADGAGASATGGRGGVVYHVTRLDGE